MNYDLYRMRFRTATHFLTSLFLLLFIASSASAQDKMYEFKGFMLGTHHDSLTIEQNKTLLKRGKYQKLIRYDVMEKPLTHAGVPLRFVKLFYWQGYLHSIDVKSAERQGNALREWVEKRFGEGTQEDAMGYKFTWEYPGYRVFMEQNLVSKDVTITFLHDETHNSYYKFMYERQYGR